jgi:predicted nuclease with TOPRIM domain
MENTEGEELEPLAVAYEQRTKEVHEARGALGEAVWALRLELGQRREEATALRRDNSELHQYAGNLTTEIDRLRERVGVLEGELRSAHDLIDVLRNMKVVRWTAWPRRIVYRLRDRHR